MKRRNFLTTSGLVGVGLCSGIAASGQIIYSNKPWHVFPDLSADELKHFDHFANELNQNLSDTSADKGMIVKLVAPKSIISKKSGRNSYQIIYKNACNNFIRIEKKKGKMITCIYTERPKVA